MDDHRVIVTRSFSTVHGLGGLRVGYAVAVTQSQRVSKRRGSARTIFLNAVAALAAVAAVDDSDHVRVMSRRNADRGSSGVRQPGQRTHAPRRSIPTPTSSC